VELTPGDIWKIQDDIKFKRIDFCVGDKVILFCKRGDGYPRFLKIGDFGEVVDIELNHIFVDFTDQYGYYIGNKLSLNSVKLPKKYFLGKVSMRDLKLSKLGIKS